MELLVTDVTEMSLGTYCVAGWHAAKGCMVRPLLRGSNWTAALLKTHEIAPGTVIQVTESNATARGLYPHQNEDLAIELRTIKTIRQLRRPWFCLEVPASSATLAHAFGGHIQHNGAWKGRIRSAYVSAGVDTRSLWAVKVQRCNLSFFVDLQKLKALLDDGDKRYMLPVSSRRLKEIFRDHGLEAVGQMLPDAGPLHVRVGLARGFEGHLDKCYLMINGVHW